VIRHVVMFKFKPDFPEEKRLDWLNRLRRLPEQIEVLKSLSAGMDVLGDSRSWDAALVAEFDQLGDIAIYTSHPAHVPLIHISGPNCEQIVSVDFEI
jgi:hypothetical protein